MLPDDYLEPLYRCRPARGGRVFTVALDPREAAFVVGRGWATVDGVCWRVSLEGCTGNVDGDKRVMVRLDNPSDEPLLIPALWPEGVMASAASLA